MQLAASDFYIYYSPHRCERRLYLQTIGAPEDPESPYVEVLRRLGARHEREHLATLPGIVDLRRGNREERRELTVQAVQDGAPAVYQPAFEATANFRGEDCEVVGEPDFLIHSNGGYIIRDSKMSRRINNKDHPEIFSQLGTYAWLYEKTFGTRPAGLQVHSGTNDIVDVPYEPSRVVAELSILRQVKRSTQEPFGAVGWSKCTGCPFHAHCWNEAEANKAVALVYGVDESLAGELHRRQVDTVEQLLVSFTEGTLSELRRPWGTKTQRVGKKASQILLMARAYSSGQEIILAAPQIPAHESFVMFDLEGMPPQLDELDKIYLWGVQVFGKKPSTYMPAVAAFGPDGERLGWEQFLRCANALFAEYGDIPFVHWAEYEATHIKSCMVRYGDPEGVAARVLANLLDLLPITQRSVALPLPSYSLKQVEKHVGFKRTQKEYGGDWSIAKFIEATETEDEKERAEVMNSILTYNQEDLEATWVVLNWLRQIRLN